MCKNSNILTIIIAVLACFLVYRCRPTKVVERTVQVTDTIVMVKHDTIARYLPQYITRQTIDTMYITDTVYVMREQKHYHEKNLYDIWVSGYKPMLDSVKVYPKTEYKTIVDVRTHYAKDNAWHLYLGGGFNAHLSAFTPQVGLSVVSPRNTLISANLGYYEGLFYGFTIQVKIR